MYFCRYLPSLGDWNRLTSFRWRGVRFQVLFPRSLASFASCVRFMLKMSFDNGVSTKIAQEIVRSFQFLSLKRKILFYFVLLFYSSFPGHLELQHNVLSGKIPSELGNIIGFQNQLDLSHNRLSGSLPTELGMLVELSKYLCCVKIEWNCNQSTPIYCFFAHSNLFSLSLSLSLWNENTNQTGGLKLSHNLLSGTIPSELSRMSKLTSIQLDDNNLSGAISTAVCTTFNITYPAFQTDCIDFDDECSCCTTCCVEGTCTCRYLGTPKEFLCYQRR